MNAQFPPDPIPDHLADTGKVEVIRQPSHPARGAGAALIVLALALTAATVVMVALPAAPAPAVMEPALQTGESATQVSAAPTSVLATDAPLPTTVMQPTLDPALMERILSQPVGIVLASDVVSPFEVVRDVYNPFTIIPDRPRTEVIEYEVQEGDTIFSIAERFGLKPETIAWANDRSIIGGLRPGRQINIMPVDGAYWTVRSEETIRQIAERFRVDPYAIIDSEFNDLFGAGPETTLQPGASVVVPGGEAETITWNARVETRDTSTNGAANAQTSGGQVIFEPGDPGSCGWVDNPGDPGTWRQPMPPGTYQWVRGYSSFHTGVDLAAPVGTPIYAANGGSVVFAGWNSYGYGYAVVLAHGPWMTLYGHMSSIGVGCGQYVNAGQAVGAVGATGNASGPHLHFEIRYNNATQDPTLTLAF
jgi:murein DD-endopeptidase MepM/ murein hydrolase activator NlpD